MRRSSHSDLLALALVCVSTAFFAGAAKADLPPGPGHDETVKVCGKCHSAEQAASLHQSRTGWEETVSKMVNMGAEGSDDEFESILTYLTKNFGPEKPKSVNVNTGTSVELESTLGLSRTESAAVVQYRTDKGPFKTVEDLKNVPGLDYAKVEAKKSMIKF
ncbi:MAG TPA: helix-hairpin-helix domain-containing protein [Bryobacteraceae bacterium]|nr:helix-hairpin-helix domain-containing protein [Bryobacteraceae bacterium]